MLKVNFNTKIPSVEEVLNAIREDTDKFGVFIDIENAMYDYFYAQKMFFDTQTKMQLLGCPAADISTVKSFIVEHGLEPFFDSTSTGVSTSEESIKTFLDNAPGKVDQKYIEIFKLYQIARTNDSLISRLNGTFSYINCPVTPGVSMSKHKMGVMSPMYSAQNTGRFASSNPALQNIPKNLQKPILTVPYGYCLCSCDSGQIDPRLFANLILKDDKLSYLINLYNDAYFGYLHYCMLTDAERLSDKCDFQKREITDELKAMRQSIKGICNGSMYGKTSYDENNMIEKLYVEHIGGHKNKKLLEEKIKAQLNTGNNIFKTAFGTEIDVSKTDMNSIKKHGEGYVMEGRIKKGLNAPIQGTSADLIRYAYMKLRDFLKEVSPKSYIITSVHDSLKVCVWKPDYSKVKEAVDECVAYEIEGCPIKIYCEAEWHFE